MALLAEAGHDAELVSLEGLDPAHAELVILTREARALVREVRESSREVPLLVLTQDGAIEERVTALEAGADDALAVPFARSQMTARVSALGRRGRMSVKPPALLECDGCFIDLDRLRASRDGRCIELTRRE